MTPFVRGKGTLSRLDRISQWIPDQKSDTSPTARWRDSFYVAESSIGNMAEWRLILEQPVAPFQKMLYDNYAGKLTLLFLILIGALVIADLLSRKIVASLGQLRTLTYELPDRLTNVGQEIDWPESGIKEIKQLVNNFRAMANTLSARLVEIRHITEEISESRQQMLDIIDFLPDATFVVDCDKKVIVWNSAMEKMTGVTKTEMLGQGNNAYTIPFYGEKRQNLLDLLEEDNETIAATYKNVLRENNTLSAETFCPALYGGKGAFVWAVVAPLFNMNGDRIGAIESIRDTTERRHTQDALKRAYDEVEMRVCERTVELDASNMALKAEIDKHKQTEAELLVAKEAADSANRAKSEFLTNMSHEIRTPMNGLLGMTQLLEVTELTQEQREYVVALKLSGKTLLSLISDILDLSRIEAGKISIELAEFGLHQCINDIFMMQKSVVFGKGLKLDIDVAGDIPHLLVGDQLRLKQILLNLLGNAVKFTNEGHISISAQLLEQHDAAVLIKISVRDTGVGILPEVLDKIFMPFTQADGSISRKYGGTGLGLTISRRLAELLGGIISVESSPGIGSCFTVTLPFTIGTTTINPQAEPATTSVWDGPPLRILFVEDDPINITFGTSLLKKMGHSVTTAENGRQCLAALEKDTFDIVLMDIQMPLMNGEEAMREIRRQEDGTAVHLPIIALTAYSMRNDKNRLLEDGFDGYVSKPLYIKDILDEMKRVIG
jgi:PAS domain S-box-containing protein